MAKISDFLEQDELQDFKSWDYNLDYKDTYKKLVNEIEKVRTDLEKGKITTNVLKKFTYLVLGLIQLRNGARIGEIIDAINIFCDDMSKKVTQVKVEKRKDNYFRKVVLPQEITKNDLEFIKKVILIHNKNKRNFVSCLSHFFKNNYSFSTHALRYAFISQMALEKVPANVIAKITGHKTLDLILHYTQKKLADNMLINFNYE